MKTINELKLSLQESHTLSRDWREEAHRHKEYYDGRQLDAETMAVLTSRGQPVQWENIYKKTGNKILGYKMTMKQQVKVGGRQREDMEVAQVLTDILSSIPDSTDYYAHKERADKDLMLCGYSVMEANMVVLPKKDALGKSEKEIRFTHVPFEEAYLDPYSKAPDYSDARYFHRVRWIDREELYRFFDEKKVDLLLNNMNHTTDRHQAEYSNMKGMKNIYRDRIQVVYTWYREWSKEKGKHIIRWYVWSNNTILGDGDSPYKYERFPFAVRKLNVGLNGEFYGLYRDIMPIQDSINFKHLRIANMLGSTKLLFEDDAVDDPDTFAEEYSKDDAVVSMRSGAISQKKIMEIKHNAEIQHLQNLIVDARRQAEQVIGLNDEMLGAAVNRMSGYAIEQRQNAGMVGLQQFLNASSKLDEDLYRIGVGLITQYFDAEQVIRIVEKDEADRYFIINEIAKKPNGEIQRQGGEPVRRNKISLGRYDVTFTMVPQNKGAMGERYTQGVELMKMVAQLDPTVALEFLPELLKDIESPSAEKMREVIDARKQNAQNDQAAQVQQQQMALSMQQMQSKIKKLESESMMNAAKAQKMLAESGTPVSVGDFEQEQYPSVDENGEGVA